MMLWSFANKSSAPQQLSFNGSQNESAMIHFGSLPSHRFTIDESDSNNYPVSQIASLLERLADLPCSVTTPVNSSFLVGQNPIPSSTPRPHVGVRTVTSVCPKSPFVGTTDFRSDSKISKASSGQLTIFYNGSVSVYDNISPEKAQAIMLLAGNEPASVTALQPVTAPVALAQHQPQPYGVTVTQPGYSFPESNHGSASTKHCEVLMHSKGVFIPARQISGAVSKCGRRPLFGFVEKRQKR